MVADEVDAELVWRVLWDPFVKMNAAGGSVMSESNNQGSTLINSRLPFAHLIGHHEWTLHGQPVVEPNQTHIRTTLPEDTPIGYVYVPSQLRPLRVYAQNESI